MKSARMNYGLALGIGLLHIPPLTLLHFGIGKREIVAFGVAYVLTMFIIFGGLHRYFSHRAFETGRPVQFVMALLGSMLFGDAVSFAGRHRLHHRNADTDRDLHSPNRGLWHSWLGHVLKGTLSPEDILVSAKELTAFPELMWLHRNWLLPGVFAGAVIWGFGGYGVFAAGFCMAPLIALHSTSAVNYFCHCGRSRRFRTPDASANNWFLAVLLFGEGWHNNHHEYPGAARAGFRWYEVDLIYYVLKAISWTGLIWNMHEVPDSYATGKMR